MDVRNLFRNLKNTGESIENDDEYKDWVTGGVTVTKTDQPETPAPGTTAETATPVTFEPQNTTESPVTNTGKVVTTEIDGEVEEEKPVQVKYFTPKDNRTATVIVEKLMEGDVVLIDFSVIDRERCVRLLDYVMGAMQALDCAKLRIDDNHICIAKSMEDIQRFCENHKEAETEMMDSPDPDDVYED